MFLTLVKKEILENLLTARFAITAILSLTLIPLGIYVNLRDYEFRERNHAEALRLHRERVECGLPGAGSEGQAFRAPSILSVFSVGLETALPSRVVTSRDGVYRVTNDQGVSNPQGHILGKFDLLSFVTVVLSLLAFIFTHGTIVGEKEGGTLRLLLTTSASRGQVLGGKLVGNYVLLVAPLLVAVAMGLVIIGRSGNAARVWSHLMPHVVLIVGFTLLFVLCMFSIGIFVAMCARTSGSAVVGLVFVWTLLVLTVPRLGPMVAEAFLPARPRQLVEMDKINARARLDREFAERRDELFERVLASRGLRPGSVLVPVDALMTPAQQQAVAEYRERVATLDREYEARLADTLAGLESEAAEASSRQSALASTLSRFSPVSSYASLVGAVTGTGAQEWDRLLAHARAYQERVESTFYDRWKVLHLGRNLIVTSPVSGTCEGNADREVLTAVVPDPLLGSALRDRWVDLGLLIVVTCGACLSAYVKFQHYDAT